jgi:hypothetical protein
VIKWKSANSFFDTREIFESIQSPKLKQLGGLEIKDFRHLSMVELSFGTDHIFIADHFENQPRFKYQVKKRNNKKPIE